MTKHPIARLTIGLLAGLILVGCPRDDKGDDDGSAGADDGDEQLECRQLTCPTLTCTIEYDFDAAQLFDCSDEYAELCSESPCSFTANATKPPEGAHCELVDPYAPVGSGDVLEHCDYGSDDALIKDAATTAFEQLLVSCGIDFYAQVTCYGLEPGAASWDEACDTCES